MPPLAEIKGSGSSEVIVGTAAGAGFGAWTAMFMGVDQASHPIVFDSTWALLTLGASSLIGQFVGVGLDVEIGIGPTSPPAEIVWGPMRHASHHTGGGRGNNNNYSFPLLASAGDQFWIRIKKADTTTAAGVQELHSSLTVWDGIQPVRPATAFFASPAHFTTGLIGPVGSGTAEFPEGGGVQFPGDNVLGFWHDITGLGGLDIDSTWLSMQINLVGIGTTTARFQLAATDDASDPGPPDLPELIDILFQSQGGGGSNVQVLGDILNFPIPWKKTQGVWIRGATFGQVNVDPLLNFRTFNITMTMWGDP